MEIFRFLFLKQGWKIFFALYVKKIAFWAKKNSYLCKGLFKFLIFAH